MQRRILIALFLLIFSGFMLNGFAQKKKESKKQEMTMETAVDSVSYAVGFYLMQQRILPMLTEMMGEKYNKKLLIRGLSDVIMEEGKLMKIEEAEDIVQKYLDRIVEDKRKSDSLLLKENKEKGALFLEKNKMEEGVRVTKSGLQYKILVEGTGIKPVLGDIVEVTYEGQLIDGTRFDGADQPESVSLERLIAGWEEGILLLNEGSEAIFYIPSELAYGDMRQGDIEPGSLLIFKVKLFSVTKQGNGASSQESSIQNEQ